MYFSGIGLTGYPIRQIFLLAGIQLSGRVVKQTATTGTTIGTLTAVGTTGTPTFTLTGSAGGKYQISGSSLQVGSTALVAGTDTITVSVSGVNPSLPNVSFQIAVYAAAVLSGGTASATGTTTGTIGVSTTEGAGTLYWTVDTSSSSPTYAQVAAGQTAAGAAADRFGNVAVTATGAQSVNVTGLAASTTYYAHFAQGDPAGNQSNIVTTASFTTAADSALLADVGSPILADVGSPILVQ